MTEPLPDAQLAEIIARDATAPVVPWTWASMGLITNARKDVPVLLVEVQRLRAELADEKGAHAKTCDNFEGYSEDTAETISDLRARLNGVRAAHRSEVYAEVITGLTGLNALAPDSRRGPELAFAIGAVMGLRDYPANTTPEN